MKYKPSYLPPTESGALPNFPIEDVTGRMLETEMKIDTAWSFDVPAKLTKATRIGDCIRATYRFVLFSATGPTHNHFDQWYAPRNEGDNCKLIPIDYETAAEINHGVREHLRKLSAISC